MKMLGPWIRAFLLLSGVAAGPFPSPPPPQDADEREVRALIGQLDSDDSSQRGRAHQELVAKGRKILPLLKPYLQSPSAEVAAQVRDIVARFERDERLEHSFPPLKTVTLPKGRLTPAEIFRQVREQTGLEIAPYGLSMRDPVDAGWDRAPVLRVLDDVCHQMGKGKPEPPPLRARTADEFGDWSESSPESSGNRIRIDGESKPPCAVAHWNQFRAAVDDVLVTETRGLQNSTVEAQLTLSLSSQPGIHPIDVGAWDFEEIVDDRGKSLRNEGKIRIFRGGRPESDPEVGDSVDSVWFTLDRPGRFAGRFGAPFPIKPPSPEARRIARLKAKVKVTFALQEMTRIVKVQEIRDKGGDAAQFGRAAIRFSNPELKENSFQLHYVLTGAFHGDPALVLLDKDGNEIRTRGGGSNSSGAEYQRHWYLNGTTDVNAIRVSAWVGHKTIEVPFEFADIPLPTEP